jgi:Ni/Fe-hydrogenase 1 B-type cytochrome subunit
MGMTKSLQKNEGDKQSYASRSRNLHEYLIWDKSIRWFHWINVLCVLGLMVVGTIILNADTLAVSGEGKISLKILHAWIGYAFAANLLYRIFWGFIGNKYARWQAVLPIGNGYIADLKGHIRGIRIGKIPTYSGHSPIGKLMVSLLLLLLMTQMITGLVIASTDLYFPPFGHEFAEWATGAGEDHSKLEGLQPGAKEILDPEGYAAMREFRKPFIAVHKLAFFTLLIAIIMHITAVVVTEIKEGNGLVSAMFTGKKVFSDPPED